MITIEGVDLEDRYAWINTNRNNKSIKVAEGVILLVSIQNAEKQFSAWSKMIESLDPAPEKVIFCENDSNDLTLELIKGWKFPHETVSFKSRPEDIKDDLYAVIAKNRQTLLERARKLKPKFAIFLDDDVFADDMNIIEKLTAHNLPIVGGAYLRPFDDKGMHVASKWNIKNMKDMPQTYNLITLLKRVEKEGSKYIIFSSCDRKLYKVSLTSAGCLCLRNDVIQNKKLNFYPIRHDLGESSGCSEDFGFCLLAKSLGYEIYLDGDTRLAHLLNYQKQRPWIVRKEMK